MKNSFFDKLTEAEKLFSAKVSREVLQAQPLPLSEATDGLELISAVFFQIDEDDIFEWRHFSMLKKILKCTHEDLPTDRATWVKCIHPDDRRDYNRAVTSLAWEGARYVKRYRLGRGDQSWIWVEETAERLPKGAPYHSHAIIRDISDEIAADAKIAWRARHDDVTGCLNKASFSEQLNILLALSRRLNTRGTVFRLRLTNLDNVHYVYGAEAGKIILESVNQRLRDIVRAPDILGVDGETDFLLAVIALSGADSDPEILKTRLEKALSDQAYVTPYGRVKVDIDICHARFSSENIQNRTGDFSPEAFLTQTYKALEPVKDSTLSEFEPHNPLSPVFFETQGEITKDDIISALNERRISLAYQPIVYAHSGELHHYECLLRLRKEDGELESAGRFIMAAEKLGLVHWLDRRALEIATQTLREHPTLKLALNVSAVTLKSDTASKGYLETLKALGPKAEHVTLELTETAALNDPAKASAFSTAVRNLGCEFSIDDFGSGHTSFRNLMAIEAETIKIDGSLIKGISTSPHMQNFVRMMVDMARTFSVKTVAEMVEDKSDAILLRRLGVDYLQGYLFGMPSATPNYEAK